MWKRRSAWAQRFSPFSESLSCGEVASGCVSAAGGVSRGGAGSAGLFGVEAVSGEPAAGIRRGFSASFSAMTLFILRRI